MGERYTVLAHIVGLRTQRESPNPSGIFQIALYSIIGYRSHEPPSLIAASKASSTKSPPSELSCELRTQLRCSTRDGILANVPNGSIPMAPSRCRSSSRTSSGATTGGRKTPPENPTRAF